MSEISRNGQQVVVKPEQDIVASMVEDFHKELKGVLEEEIESLTIDLAKVRMIDSMGLGVLIATHNSLQKKGLSLELANPSEDIMKLLKTMRLDQHFVINDAS